MEILNVINRNNYFEIEIIENTVRKIYDRHQSGIFMLRRIVDCSDTRDTVFPEKESIPELEILFQKYRENMPQFSILHRENFAGNLVMGYFKDKERLYLRTSNFPHRWVEVLFINDHPNLVLQDNRTTYILEKEYIDFIDTKCKEAIIESSSSSIK